MSWRGHGGHGRMQMGGGGRRSSRSGGFRGGFRGGRFGGRFPRWHGLFGGAPIQPDPQMQWAQGCLAQTMDPSIPQTGFWNPQTHQAIQTFQTQQQLPPTGLLDPNTVGALQAACSGQAGDAGAGAPPPGSPSGPPPGPPPGGGGGGGGGGRGGGRHGSHEIGTSQEGEFPGERRWDRHERFREERRREEHPFHERRWPFLFEAQAGSEGEWGGRRERRREERHEERHEERRREEHRDRRWPFLFEAEAGSEGEWGGRRERRREERHEERRREERPFHERRWPPFAFEAEAGSEGDWGGRRERRREERHEERREEHPFRERRWPFLFEAEAGSQGEWGFGRREHRREERREEHRREERPFHERRWPFAFEAETGAGQGESEYRFRGREPFERGRAKWDRGWFFGLPENHRIAWAQSCLAQVLGPWVVQDGIMGPNTARALRAFQERNGLAVTGVLDEETAHALHHTCGH